MCHINGDLFWNLWLRYITAWLPLCMLDVVSVWSVRWLSQAVRLTNADDDLALRLRV